MDEFRLDQNEKGYFVIDSCGKKVILKREDEKIVLENLSYDELINSVIEMYELYRELPFNSFDDREIRYGEGCHRVIRIYPSNRVWKQKKIRNLMKLYDAISDEAEERGKEELRNEELKKKA